MDKQDRPGRKPNPVRAGRAASRARKSTVPGAARVGTLDPMEMALEPERHGLTDGAAAQRVLLKHERMIEAQTSHLGRQRWRDFIVTAFGILLLVTAGFFVWDASRAQGVVIEAFAVPPDMAERGLTGPVLATQMLDRLTTMQSQTDSLRAASTYANDWGGDIAVEIPNTGVSIGEVRRYLREWLGDQTRLSGEVVRLTDGRIALTTRVGANPPTRSEGAEAELATLVQRGAEAIFGETQPYRYGVWLGKQGRAEEAVKTFEALTRSSDINDRLWASNGLASNAVGDARERYYLAALRLRPDFTPALSGYAALALAEGREEAAYSGYLRLLDKGSAARRDMHPGRANTILSFGEETLALLTGDMGRAAELTETRIDLPSSAIDRAAAPVSAAYSYFLAHNISGGRRVLAEQGLDEPEAMAERLQLIGTEYEVETMAAWAVGDFVAEREGLVTILAEAIQTEPDPIWGDITVFIRSAAALAQARTGQIADARANIAPTPLDCAPCVRARGLVEAYAGNPRGADHWLSESVRITPSLPAAHSDWAEAYLVRGDPARAIVQARLAVQKGPKWVDPRKQWGDALMMQGDAHGAVRRYREAVRLAPNWGALHLALGRAQAAAGQVEAARDSFERASRLPLSPADREALAEARRLNGSSGSA